MIRRFSGWTSRGSSRPAPVAMASAPLAAFTIWPGSAVKGSSRAVARQIKILPRDVSAVAPGQGLQPRIRLTRARAGSVHRRTPSAFLSRGAGVASSRRWGVGVSVPRRSSVFSKSAAPRCPSRAASSPAVSLGSMGVASWRRIGPVSIPSSMRNVVMPVSVSPPISAHATGAAPR